MAFAKFQENRFRIDREITENHAILVNLTASTVNFLFIPKVTLKVINQDRMFFADFSVNRQPIFMKFCNNHISTES